jgi:hypothetical protein
VSFSDVLSKSSEEIERAAGREPPFGKELRIGVSKILMNTLQLSAYIDSEGDIPRYIVCNLARREALPGIEHVESDELARIVKYTLLVYTDRPGGIILSQQNIFSVGEYRLPYPEACGKIFVHLIASMVGLDGKFINKEVLHTHLHDNLRQSSSHYSCSLLRTAYFGRKL